MQIKRKVTHIKPYLLSILNLKNNFSLPSSPEMVLTCRNSLGFVRWQKVTETDGPEKDHWLLGTVSTSLLWWCQLPPLQQMQITFPVSFGSYYVLSTDFVVWWQISEYRLTLHGVVVGLMFSWLQKYVFCIVNSSLLVKQKTSLSMKSALIWIWYRYTVDIV